MPSCLDQLKARTDPERIAFLKFILEGYDHLAQLSTLDCTSGKIVFRFHHARRETLLALLEELEVIYDYNSDGNNETAS